MDLNFNLNNKIVQRIEQTNKRYKEDFKKFKIKENSSNKSDKPILQEKNCKNCKMKKGLPGLISYEEPGYVKWFLRGLFLPCGAGFCLGQRNNERWTCQKYLLPIFLTIFVTAMGFVIEPYFLEYFKVRDRQTYESNKDYIFMNKREHLSL